VLETLLVGASVLLGGRWMGVERARWRGVSSGPILLRAILFLLVCGATLELEPCSSEPLRVERKWSSGLGVLVVVVLVVVELVLVLAAWGSLKSLWLAVAELVGLAVVLELVGAAVLGARVVLELVGGELVVVVVVVVVLAVVVFCGGGVCVLGEAALWAAVDEPPAAPLLCVSAGCWASDRSRSFRSTWEANELDMD